MNTSEKLCPREVCSSSCFELHEQDGVLVLEVWGEVVSVHWHPADVDSAVLAALDGRPNPELAVDLVGVTYGGSQFVEFLLGLGQLVRARDGRMVLSGARAGVSDVLCVFGIQ